MLTRETLRQHRDAILRIAETNGVCNVRVFGSVARGDASETSDVDFLVSLRPGASGWGPGGFLMDAQDLLGCKVDVAMEGGLKPRVRERVLREATPL
ncbi:MAG: nucleotidyltransferase family protein [Verrucomicrobia bacterium]|nr:nucleotidyltransferase family protein [Verrucomicrobiota bacterium]